MQHEIEDSCRYEACAHDFEKVPQEWRHIRHREKGLFSFAEDLAFDWLICVLRSAV